MVCQSSYPLKSENARPPGTCNANLSCAAKARPTRIDGNRTIATAAPMFSRDMPHPQALPKLKRACVEKRLPSTDAQPPIHVTVLRLRPLRLAIDAPGRPWL